MPFCASSFLKMSALAVACLPLLWLLLRRWRPTAYERRPTPGAGLLLCVVGILLFLSVQPFTQPGEKYAAGYWLLLGLLKLVASFGGWTILRVALGPNDILGGGRQGLGRSVLWALFLYAAAWPLVNVLYDVTVRDGDMQQSSARALVAVRGVPVRAAMAFCLVLATPILEEVAFRGLLQSGLRKVMSPAAAVVAVACLFSIVHPQQYWPSIFALAVLFGYIYERTGSIWPSIAVHALHNLPVYVALVAGDAGTGS